MALALFDLDRTLLSVNAGALWVRAELRAGFVTRWQATRAAAWIFGYHLGYSRLEAVLEDAIASMAGADEAELVRRTTAFYHREVAPRYRARAREVVATHRARGDLLALLTTSSSYLSAPVQAELGIPHALCNRLEVADGRFTGRAEGPLCFGAGKLTHLERFAEAHGERLADATFYTDSHSDLPVLEAVGHPVAVHPDPRLARVARQRGWPIEDWDRT